MNKPRLKFVTGGQEACQQFHANIASVYQNEQISNSEINILPTKKLIFKQGQEKDDVSNITKSKQIQETKTSVNTSQKPSIKNYEKLKANNQTSNSGGEIAANIHAELIDLLSFYEALTALNSNYGEIFKELQSELEIMILAMQKISQNLLRNFKLKRNTHKANFSSFEVGLGKTANLQRHILFDLRCLQRNLEGQPLLLQLIIIYLTIQSQYQTILQIMQEL